MVENFGRFRGSSGRYLEWIFVARSQGNMTQNGIFCQQKSVSPLNAKGYKSVTFPMDFHGFRAIYPGREFPTSAIQADLFDVIHTSQ